MELEVTGTVINMYIINIDVNVLSNSNNVIPQTKAINIYVQLGRNYTSIVNNDFNNFLHKSIRTHVLLYERFNSLNLS